jgi:hypothetical protein
MSDSLEARLQMRNVILKSVPCVAVWLVVTGLAVSSSDFAAASQDQTEKATPSTKKTKAVIYTNKKYGFCFALPESWKGYSISVSEWEGGDGGTYQSHEDMPPPQKGPFISIGHPFSTKSNPRQNIQIMVFTKAQWRLVEEDKLIVSAAPIGPSELGRNAKYVFALPPRFNYALIDGWEQVNEIIQNHPLRAF